MKSLWMAVLLAVSLPAVAQQLADGEVRKVDKIAGKLTIKHGPIQSVDMPAMTMVFTVKDSKMLDRVKPGDRIKFDAEMLPGGKLSVTRIETVK